MCYIVQDELRDSLPSQKNNCFSSSYPWYLNLLRDCLISEEGTSRQEFCALSINIYFKYNCKHVWENVVCYILRLESVTFSNTKYKTFLLLKLY